MTDKFEKRLREQLRDSEAQLDAATRSRLTAARHRALEAAQKTGARGWQPGWAPVAAAISVAMVVVVIYASVDRVPGPSSASELEPLLLATAGLADFEEQDIELYEDLEFYAWLALEGSAG